ncbi:MAG: hypothetical protein AB7I50_09875 [Vicinamibacterales bacterium]
MRAAIAQDTQGVQRGVCRPTLVDPYLPFVRDTLAKYPRLRATRLSEMVRERGYAGAVVQLRRAGTQSTSVEKDTIASGNFRKALGLSRGRQPHPWVGGLRAPKRSGMTGVSHNRHHIAEQLDRRPLSLTYHGSPDLLATGGRRLNT